MSTYTRLRRLTEDEVWERVREFAEDKRRSDELVPTLTHEVPNRILEVTQSRIGRWSPRVKGKIGYVRKAQLLEDWRALARPGGGRPPNWYFDRALLMGAFPGLVRHDHGHMWLAGDPVMERRKEEIRRKAVRGGGGLGGGEGEQHRRLKEFILNHPNKALAGLEGGPFVGHDTEYQFETGDEVDVFLSDARARAVLVEVEPALASGNRAPWGQALKYRALYMFFKQVPQERVRTVVAAPAIPRTMAKRMRRQYGIENAIVTLPRTHRKSALMPGKGTGHLSGGK